MSEIIPITFPARPIHGGRLELAPPKRGVWFAEPKYNGWRALVHTPTGTMWNRHGKRLSIAAEFGPAQETLRSLARHGLVWADCEALERRHAIGRGSLVVLDWICETGAPGYEERRDFLSWIGRRGPPPLVRAARLALAAKSATESFTSAFAPADRALERL